MKKNIRNIMYFIIISLLFLSLFIFNNNPIEKFQGTPSGDTTVYDIIIVAGQSNAIGRGERNVCDRTDLPGCSSGINLRRNSSRQGAIIDISGYDFIDMTKIKMFTCESDIRYGMRTEHFNKIIGMREPLEHFEHRSDTDDGNTLSIASSFAKEYINRISMGSKKLLIVGCAASGSSINEWRRKYGANNPDPDSYYDITVERLRKVRSVLSRDNISKVVALLWHQGESDMTYTFANLETRNTRKLDYKSKLEETLRGMRHNIRLIFRSNNGGYTFPILLGGLSYDKQFNRITGVRNTSEYRKEMSDLIKEVSTPTDENYIPTSAFVSSDRLAIASFNTRLEGNSIMDSSGRILGDDDNSHFSATAIREFGKRYFYYYNLIK